MEEENIDTDISFHEAVRRGDIITLKKFIEAGQDVNCPDWEGSGDPSILQTSDIHVIRLLCDAGCDVNARNVRGETALHLAAAMKNNFSEDTSLIMLLLDAGCDPDIQDNMNGRTAMHILIRQLANSEYLNLEQKRAFQVLAEKTNLNITDSEQQTPLQILVNSGINNLEYLQILIDNNADPSVQNGRGETALHEALETGWTEGAIALIAAKSDLTNNTRYRETPLHIAARRNRLETVPHLLSNRAPVNARDLHDNTALHLAAAKGYATIVDMILAVRETDINAANRDGITPLHIAVESGFIPVVKLLLKVDACDLQARTKMGHSPLDLAQQEYRRRSQPEMSLILLQEMERRKGLERQSILPVCQLQSHTGGRTINYAA
ncbi:putative ankyrin repeat protein RF_0381 [Nilaparvata lugens]|uniref:putative ankyrin repeat protein RF_0381 n=1 Tax=Nilaparvata lugens TaxID=108931 RepID=UPI00193D4E77|nr:putative ankyrin repeat protein RF_0381 [Nilaparvata lugens]XP_039288108.1 putative ankyrin repeat protein RF_0381 [Nilaparvata lugens]XP_039288109.1 putative ankyrin repeat protein RF_0381 [Nilaparvata lugens]